MAQRKSTIDWARIELEYLAGEDSIREIADRHEISDTAIRKRAKEHGWVREVRSANRCEPARQPPPPPRSDPETPRDAGQIADDGRSLVGRMAAAATAQTATSGSNDNTATIADLRTALAALTDEVKQLRSDNNDGNAAIAANTGKSAKALTTAQDAAGGVAIGTKAVA